MENLEVVVLALALLLTTTNIHIYAWFAHRERYLHAGVWILRVTGVFPGLIVIIWAMYAMATDHDSLFAKTLLTAGILLLASAIQLLSLLLRKRLAPPGEADHT